MNLDKKSLPPYLRRKKIVVHGESVRDINQIGDSTKNIVYSVVTSQKRLIVKQAHSRIQNTKERIFLDRKRIFQENACMQVLSDVLPPDFVPSVILEDRSNFILVTSAPSRDALLWEEELARGRVDLQIAAQCGEALATIHNQTNDARELKTMFKDKKTFDQLRIEPTYDRIANAFPELKTIIEDRTKELRNERKVLVLGDLRPRNVWVNNGQIFLVDFAAAHFGSPTFDIAQYCSDLCLKAIINSPQKAAYLEGINVYWLSYFDAAQYPRHAKVERTALKDFGCILLANGNTPPVEMDDETRDLTCRIAQNLMFTELEKIEEITEYVNRTLIDG